MVTVRNVIIMAMAQVAVIVAGVLAAAVALKVMTTGSIEVSSETSAFATYGAALLLLPLAWITVLLSILRSPNAVGRYAGIVYLMGIVLLAGLLWAAWSTAIGPFFRVCFFSIGG